uniref:Uncharacterized protein n=1 Tax=Kalanchoe fedtschenkoi TaxID=63787 RepID=A0A7N0VHV4_KALFE
MGGVKTRLLSLVALAGLLIGAGIASAELDDDVKLVNVSRLEMFVDELPEIPRLYGYDVVGGARVSKTLKIGMFKKEWKFHKQIPRTTVYAFGTSPRAATVPGPTIEAHRGVPTKVKWSNHLPPKHILPWDPTIPTAVPERKSGIPTVVHLHGGIHGSESDGNAHSWFTRRFMERGPAWSTSTYNYLNNQQPGTMWYHDHAMGLTRVNILAGLLGAYVLRDPVVEGPLKLPHGQTYDRTLVVFDRSFSLDGSIYMDRVGNNPNIHPQWQPEYFGNAIIVNGKAWPYLSVRRRKYRFRIINSSNARFFRFFFDNGLKFIHVASDSAYHDKPVVLKEMLVAPSEIADVVVDFSTSKTDSAVLQNGAPYPYPGGDPVDEFNGKVMKFVIDEKPAMDTSLVPATLIKYPPADVKSAVRTRYIAMYEYTSSIDEPTHLYINGKSYDAPATEIVKAGTTEVWQVINLTEDNHPLHIHVGLFKTLSQTELINLEEFKACMTKKNDAVKCQLEKHARGNVTAVPEHERGWKNVFKMQPGFVTKILVRFGYIHNENETYSFDATKGPGYVYHCHILDHEDNVMMRPLVFTS